MGSAARRRARRHKIVLAGATVVVAVGGGVAWAATRSSGPIYRTATVTRADVTQTVNGVGSIDSVRQRSLAFGVSGTVKKVGVSVGSTVRAGDVLASLDTTSLEQQLQSAEADVASARQQLAADQSAQASSADDASDSSSSHSTDSASTRALSSSPSHPQGRDVTAATIAADQQAVIAAQAKVDALLDGPVSAGNPHVLSVDIAAMQAACASSAVTFSATSTSDGRLVGTVAGGAGLPVSLVGGTYADGTAVAATTVGADGSYSFGSVEHPLRASAAYTVQLGDGSSGVVGTGACAEALQTVAEDERTVQHAERDLAAAEQKLDADLAAYLASVQQPTDHQSSTPSASQPTAPTGADSSGDSPNPTGTTITAAQLAADQKRIDAAIAQRAVAQQNLAAATLRSPIDGTVGAVSMTAGSAASAANVITVIGHGRKSITVPVGISEIDTVHAGQSALITIDGVSTPLRGTVTQVGVLNTSGTSGSSSTYPVTIILDATTLPLYDGAGATVAIDVGTKHDVLTVPTSAVHRNAAGATVQTYSGGRVSTRRVAIGAAGVDRVEIT